MLPRKEKVNNAKKRQEEATSSIYIIFAASAVNAGWSIGGHNEQLGAQLCFKKKYNTDKLDDVLTSCNKKTMFICLVSIWP